MSVTYLKSFHIFYHVSYFSLGRLMSVTFSSFCFCTYTPCTLTADDDRTEGATCVSKWDVTLFPPFLAKLQKTYKSQVPSLIAGSPTYTQQGSWCCVMWLMSGQWCVKGHLIRTRVATAGLAKEGWGGREGCH